MFDTPHGKRSYLTVPEAARLLGVSEQQVLAWLKLGHLRGFTTGAARGEKPHWRVTRRRLKQFAQEQNLEIMEGRSEDG